MHMDELISNEIKGVGEIEDAEDEARRIFDDGLGESDYEDTESDTSVEDEESDAEDDEESDEKAVELNDTVSCSWL